MKEWQVVQMSTKLLVPIKFYKRETLNYFGW